MLARLLLKLPWFLSAPAIVAMAMVMAAGLHLVAGTYFQRSFRDDTDPLAGLVLSVATAPAGGPAASGGGVAPAAAGATQPAIPAASGGATTAAAPTSGTSAVPPAAGAAPVTATAAPAAAPSPPAAGGAPAAGILAQGVFVDGDPGHNGKGRARLIRGADGALTLRFEDFSVTNGPDLFVILSTDPSGSRSSATNADALNLGRLKATDGNVNYAVPAGTDTSRFRSVIVYCRAFRIVFAVSTLEAP